MSHEDVVFGEGRRSQKAPLGWFYLVHKSVTMESRIMPSRGRGWASPELFARVMANSSGLLSGVKKRQNYTAVGAHNLIIVLETLIYTLSVYVLYSMNYVSIMLF